MTLLYEYVWIPVAICFEVTLRTVLGYNSYRCWVEKRQNRHPVFDFDEIQCYSSFFIAGMAYTNLLPPTTWVGRVPPVHVGDRKQQFLQLQGSILLGWVLISSLVNYLLYKSLNLSYCFSQELMVSLLMCSPDDVNIFVVFSNSSLSCFIKVYCMWLNYPLFLVSKIV